MKVKALSLLQKQEDVAGMEDVTALEEDLERRREEIRGQLEERLRNLEEERGRIEEMLARLGEGVVLKKDNVSEEKGQPWFMHLFELSADILEKARKGGWEVNRAAAQFAVVDKPWDADASEKRWRKWVSDKDPEDWGEEEWRKYAKRFLAVNTADPHKFESYKLPVLDIVDGKPRLVRRAVIAVQQVLAGARGGVDLPSDVKKKLEGVADRLREKADEAVEGEE